jgi:hypothetical protein
MLGALLGKHPSLLTIPEAQFFVDCMPKDIGATVVPIDVITAIKAHYRFRIWQFDLPVFDRKEATYKELFEWLITCYSIHVDKTNIAAWIDHQPGHVKHIEKIQKIYPQLKVIHIVRDGRAVANSIMPLDWGPNTINRAAYFYEQRVGYGLAVEKYLGTQNAIQIRYEDLVGNLDDELNHLFEFIGVKTFNINSSRDIFSVPNFTKSQHSLVGNSVVGKRVNGWEKELTKREQEIFESITGDLLCYLGYQKKFAQSKGMSWIEKLTLEVKNILMKTINNYKFKNRVNRHIK